LHEWTAKRSIERISLPRLHYSEAIKVVSQRIAPKEFLHVEDEDECGNKDSYQ
jgi:hypothetical protein